MAGQKPLSINEDKDVRKVKRNVEKLFNDFLCYGVNRKVLSSLNKINDDLPDDKDSVGIKIALFKLLELKALNKSGDLVELCRDIDKKKYKLHFNKKERKVTMKLIQTN
jgi:hypothetical protein